MNSHLTRIALVNNIKSLPEWKHDLADMIGAPAVFYRFNSAKIEDDVMYISNPSELEWVRGRYMTDLRKILGITEVKGVNE